MASGSAPDMDREQHENMQNWPPRPVVPFAAERPTLPPFHPDSARTPVNKKFGAAVMLLLVAIAVSGGVLYWIRHSPTAPAQNAAAASPKPLPRSGDSPSAYDYLIGRKRSRFSPARAATPGGAARTGYGTAPGIASGAEYALSSGTIEDFIAEVIDGDRHMLIHFRRVPQIRVATEKPLLANAPPQPVSAPGGLYVDQRGWWSLTRPSPTEPAPKDVVATVVLNAVIGPDGHVDRAEVISGPRDLAVAAMEAVKRWQYPAPAPGESTQRQVTVNFSVSPK